MCLLQTGKSNDIRTQLLNTEGLISSIFKKNGDGLGFMFSDNGELKTYKFLPPDEATARQIVEAMPDDDREIAVHWRWRTHGDIDLENCHPYWINEEAGIALMHNGVLSTGNAGDTKKSDTWHFAKNFLSMHPADVLHDFNFRRLVASFIGGNNKFAIMSADGRLSVLNKSSGVEAGNVWFSNTYAWDSELLIPRKSYGGHQSWAGYGRYLGDGDDSGFGVRQTALTHTPSQGKKKRIKGQSTKLNKAAKTLMAEALGNADDVDRRAVAAADMREFCDEVLDSCDAHFLAIALEDRQQATLWRLMADYNFVLHEAFTANKDSWSDRMAKAAQAWVAKDRAALEKMDVNVVAEALLYCTEWSKTEVRKAYDGTSSTDPIVVATAEALASDAAAGTSLAEQIAATEAEAIHLAGVMGVSKQMALEMIAQAEEAMAADETSLETSDDSLSISQAHDLFASNVTPSLTLVQ